MTKHWLQLTKIIKTQWLIDVLTPAGLNSIHYFLIRNRIGQPRIGDLNRIEIRVLTRYLRYPAMSRVINLTIGVQVINVPNDCSVERNRSVDDIRKLSRKQIRTSWKVCAEELICNTKLD